MTQAGLEFVILLLQSLQYWDHRLERPHPGPDLGTLNQDDCVIMLRLRPLCVLQKGNLDPGQKLGLQFRIWQYLDLFAPAFLTPQREGHLAGLLGRAS